MEFMAFLDYFNFKCMIQPVNSVNNFYKNKNIYKS